MKIRSQRARRAIATAMCILFMITLSASPAYSTHGDGSSDSELGYWYGVSAFMLLTGGILGLTDLSDSGDSSASKEAYIRDNAIALQQDLSLGGGATIEHLAGAYYIPEQNVPRFAQAVRNQRRELLPLTDVHRLDADGAERFFEIIGEAVEDDPRLRANAE